MWRSRVAGRSDTVGTGLECLLSGEIPMMIFREFYERRMCRKVVERIKKHDPLVFQNGKLAHIGPFLMAHATEKEKYFEAASEARMIFEDIFCAAVNPLPQIYEVVGAMLPGHSVSVAHEFQDDYSPAVIRIHEKGGSVPLHKDNVCYEGKEYALSGIDRQLSCVLHLQESEGGGELVVYDRVWKKADEQFRSPSFGYLPDLVCTSRSCRAPGIGAGDLVIINPRHYHEVTRITGDTPRITLGMFLGFSDRDSKIVAWA